MAKKTSIKIDHAHLNGPIRTSNPLIKIEPMKETAIPINYQFVKTIFGDNLIASTKKGVCYFGFVIGNKKRAYHEFISRFPEATFKETSDTLQKKFLAHLSNKKPEGIIPLHLNGTPFQQKTWQALLHIPKGTFATYGSIAKFIKHPEAHRAVGTAVGMNPVSILVPCHRVVQATGTLGSYHWGADLKAKIIEGETSSV